MLTMVWHWFTGWIISWGGVGGLIAAGAWALWFFCPAALLTYKAELMYIAIAATVIAATNTHSFTTGYNSGYKVAINQVANNTKEAKDAIKKSVSDTAECFARGGTPDDTTGMCDR